MPRRECFVTTGATAKFEALIRAALSPDSLQAFSENEFTHLNIQYGECSSLFEELKPEDENGLHISGFGFNREGLNQEMRATQWQNGWSEKGLLICHAGAGTVLEAMRLGLSIIVVPNESLLDNHQKELAEELEEQGYVTQSSTKDLAKAIKKACKKEEKAWGGHPPKFAGVVDSVVYDASEEASRARMD